MSKRFQAERILEDLENGHIDEYDAKQQLKRLDSCSCMSERINKIVRDVNGGWRDSFDGSRDFECESRRCEINREMGGEYEGY